MIIKELLNLLEAKDPSLTIQVPVVPEDEHDFMNVMKGFKKLKVTKPEWMNNRKMSASVTGSKRELISFLSSDDGAGKELSYIKKNYPELFK